MQTIDITAKIKNVIRYAPVCIIILAMAIGYAEFKYWHKDETLQLNDAKVAGTMVSVRVLTTGKVKELLFEDGAEVKAGDVIARLEVNVTEEEIQQLENTVQLAKNNYASLSQGQWVKVAVQRERVVTHAPVAVESTPSAPSAPPANLSKLEERANRMAQLFEMGAVSAKERDAARRAYENALSESQSPSSQTTYTTPEPTIEHYTEYVDEFRPTPPEVLAGAEQAIKQAELSLNVAKQEARETDVIAPVSGTIYYGTEIDKELSAGESVARIGDSRELWIEAEVTEDIFDKITLGKLVSYTIDGKEIFGTVTEKIKPDVQEPVDLPEIPTTENQPGELIGQTPDGQAPADDKTSADAQAPADDKTSADGQAPANGQAPADAQAPADGQAPVDGQAPADGQTPADAQAPKLLNEMKSQPKPHDKFMIKISLPVERDFDCRPNTETVVKIKV